MAANSSPTDRATCPACTNCPRPLSPGPVRPPDRGVLSLTWWGHSFATVELPGSTVVTDPLMVRRLLHLRRDSPPPPGTATRADLVLVSHLHHDHLHHDHLHVPTLRRFDDAVPIVVPRGAVRAAADEAGLGDRVVIPPMGVRTTLPRGTMPL